MKREGEREALIMWDCGSPLYDSFELASLSNLIERHTMVLPSLSTTSFQSSSSSSFSTLPASSLTASSLSASSDSWRSRPSDSSAQAKVSEVAALKNKDSGSTGVHRSRWELYSRKRKLEERQIETPDPKKVKTEGCFCFGFFK